MKTFSTREQSIYDKPECLLLSLDQEKVICTSDGYGAQGQPGDETDIINLGNY